MESAKKNYVLAEKLWADGKYAAAVSEFEKVTMKDPMGKLGTMAQYRAATTQAYFLSQYGEALRKLKRFTEVTQDPVAKWDAQKQIGEILYTRVEQYDQAIHHYRSLVALKPQDPDVPEFLFRVGKSHFFLRQFNEAVEVYRDIFKRFPQTAWAEKAFFEIGVCFYTQGGKGNSFPDAGADTFQQSIDSFERFIKTYPKSELIPQARFYMASSLEEMDLLDEAYRAYEALKSVYPSPKVVQIKMIRIKERQAQRSH